MKECHSPQNSGVQSQKIMILVCFQGKPLEVTVIKIRAPTTSAEEAEVHWFYEDIQYLLELMPKNKISFSS